MKDKDSYFNQGSQDVNSLYFINFSAKIQKGVIEPLREFTLIHNVFVGQREQKSIRKRQDTYEERKMFSQTLIQINLYLSKNIRFRRWSHEKLMGNGSTEILELGFRANSSMNFQPCLRF